MTNREKLFLILAEELNFRRAAEKSFLSQQCLSDHIKRLENEYGILLFSRKPSVRLTEAGKAVQRTLQLVKTLESGLESELREMENGACGTLKIGVNYTRAKLLIPTLFAQYHPAYPRVRIELVLEETVVMQDLLYKGELAFFIGLNAKISPPLRTMHLAYENIYLMASSAYLQHHFKEESSRIISAKDGVDLYDFQGLPFATNYGTSTTFQYINQYMNSCGITINNVLSVSDYEVSERICRAGYAASFCPQIFIPTILNGNESHDKDHHIHIMPIQGLHPLRFELIYNEMIHYPRYTWDCIKMLKDITQSYYDQFVAQEQ